MKLKGTMGKLSSWPCLLQMSKNEASQFEAIFWNYPWNSIWKSSYFQVWLKRQLRHNNIELKWDFKQARKWESIQIKRQSHFRNRSLQAFRIWSEKVEHRKFCLWKCFSSQIRFGRLQGERGLWWRLIQMISWRLCHRQKSPEPWPWSALDDDHSCDGSSFLGASCTRWP